MAKIYTHAELQDLIDMHKNPEKLADSESKALDIINDLGTNPESDIEDEHILGEFIKEFGTSTYKGEVFYTEPALRVIARYEWNANALKHEISERDPQWLSSNTTEEIQYAFDSITFKIYQDMGLIDSTIDLDNLTPKQLKEMICSKDLSKAQEEEYANKFIDAIINDDVLFEKVPPRILTQAYLFTVQQIFKGDKSIEAKYQKLALKIDNDIKKFPSTINFYKADGSNFAAIYAGYKEMCDARSRTLALLASDSDADKKYKQDRLQEIEITRKSLDELMKDFLEMYNLTDIKPENADELDNRWRAIAEKLKNVELTNEVLSALSKYKFLDEAGNPTPQFIDSEGKPQLEFKPGYTLNPDGRLARIVSLAKNDVNMLNFADIKKKIEDIDLNKAVNERVPEKIAEISVISQIVSDPEHATPDTIKTDSGEISDEDYQIILDTDFNRAATVAGLTARKIGTSEKPIIDRPFEAIQEIDAKAETRTERTGAFSRKKKLGFFKRIVKNFTAAAVVSAGLTFIGKATGLSYVGAAIGATIGVGNMIYQRFKWKKEQKKAGKPYGLKAYFSDKRNWGPAVASGLGIAAMISMATGNLILGSGLGIGSLVAGGGSAAKMAYDDALAAGYTKKQALGCALGVAGAAAAGAAVGNITTNGLTTSLLLNDPNSIFASNELNFPAGGAMLGAYEPRPVPDGYIETLDERTEDLTHRATHLTGDNGRTTPGTEKTPSGGGTPKPSTETPDKDTNKPKDQPKKRGFFGWIQKLQQGVHNIMTTRIENKTARKIKKQEAENALQIELQKGKNAVEALQLEGDQKRAEAMVKLSETYKEKSVKELLEIVHKNATARAINDDELQTKIGKELTELETKLTKDRLTKLNDVQILKDKLLLYLSMGDGTREDAKAALETLKDLKKLNNEIDALETEGEINRTEGEINRAKAEAQGKVDIDVIDATGNKKVQEIKGDVKESKGRGIRKFFKGLLKKDSAEMKEALEVAKYELEISKTNGARKVWDAANKELAQLQKNDNYSQEDKDRLAKEIIDNAKKQRV